MKLTDTLDHILRMLLATDGSSGEGRRPDAVTARPAMDAELEARAAQRVNAPEPAVVTEQPAAAPARAELARLETTVGVVEKLGLGFHLGSAVERIAAAATEGSAGGQKLHEATWLIDRYLELLERRPVGADLHVTMTRLAREGDAIAGLQAIASALGEPEPPAPRFSTALPAATQEPEAAPEPTAAAPTVQPPSFRRELALTGARALIVIAAVVVVVLVLTLISQWR